MRIKKCLRRNNFGFLMLFHYIIFFFEAFTNTNSLMVGDRFTIMNAHVCVYILRVLNSSVNIQAAIKCKINKNML